LEIRSGAGVRRRAGHGSDARTDGSLVAILEIGIGARGADHIGRAGRDSNPRRPIAGPGSATSSRCGHCSPCAAGACGTTAIAWYARYSVIRFSDRQAPASGRATANYDRWGAL
jgi:hypothetical protein